MLLGKVSASQKMNRKAYVREKFKYSDLVIRVDSQLNIDHDIANHIEIRGNSVFNTLPPPEGIVSPKLLNSKVFKASHSPMLYLLRIYPVQDQAY